jgi:hypothetical protein
MSDQNPSAKSAINPLSFMPFAVYILASIIGALSIKFNLGYFFEYIGGFLSFIKSWIVPGVMLLVAGLTISKKVVSLALSISALLWQMFISIGASYLQLYLTPSGISYIFGSGWNNRIILVTTEIAVFVAPILAIVMAAIWKPEGAANGAQAPNPYQAPPAMATGTPAPYETPAPYSAPAPTGVSAGVSQWAIQVPGQPETQVTTEQLSYWAKTRAIRPETVVRDVQNNATYPASQIPGVYSDKTYITAVLLSFFLGVLGIDRFYTGHIGLGIGKLLTGGGCGIWALVDLILYATRKVNDATGRPLR